MKKKLFGMALIAVFLMVMFSACDIEVISTAPKASKPSNVIAETFNMRYVKLSWKAASGATGYNLYAQKVGTKTIISLSASGQNDSIYMPKGTDDFDKAKNLDIDAWSALIYVYNYSTAGGNAITTGNYKFGVSARDADPNHTSSDIAWSKPFNVLALQ